jgi:hypothetical protein
MKKNIILLAAIALVSSVSAFEYKPEDTNAAWSQNATQITLNGTGAKITGSGASVSGKTITISQAGDYVLTGVWNDGQILVNAGKNALVRLVLNGVRLSSSTGTPLYLKQAKKTVLILPASTQNAITDAVSYVFPVGTDEPDAAIFAADDLSITGSGALTVNGRYRNAIASKDTLVITGGTITVTAVNQGLRGGDALAILDGTFVVDAKDDAFHTNGDLTVSGGSFSVQTGDDAFHADKALRIDNGRIAVSKCYEGLEGATVDINGGTITLTSSDDAINAAGGSSPYVRITGGTIEALSRGDGIDANGNVYLDGGVVKLSGPSMGMQGAIDFDRSFVITGGRLITAGTSLPPASQSTQPSLLVSYTSQVLSGSVISIADATGRELLTYTSRTACTASAFTSPDFAVGKTYTLLVDGKKRADIKLSGMVTMIAENGGAYSAGRGGGGRGSAGQRSPGWR